MSRPIYHGLVRGHKLFNRLLLENLSACLYDNTLVVLAHTLAGNIEGCSLLIVSSLNSINCVGVACWQELSAAQER